MNREETMKVLAYLREMYPHGKPITKNTIAAWQDTFSEFPYEVIWAAAKRVVQTWDGYVMPPPAAIFKVLKEMNPQEDTAIELWRIAEKAIKRGTVITQSEFDALPEAVRIYFGGISAIRDLALLDMGEIPNERARFIKQMPTIMERIETQHALPEQYRMMLADMKQITA